MLPSSSGSLHTFFFKIKKKIFYLLLERVEGKEKERERNINVWLPLTRPLLGTWPINQAGALTGNRTSDPLVCRLVLNALSYNSQGLMVFINYESNPCLL